MVRDPEAQGPDSMVPPREGEVALGPPVGMQGHNMSVEISNLLFSPSWHLIAALTMDKIRGHATETHAYGARPRGAAGAMSLLAWNCRGSGGSLGSAKMLHLSRLLASTSAQFQPKACPEACGSFGKRTFL
ncbi:hypothetical protein U9M48_043106 [Paspalum notatum var. saurae]|uniref:Uncharacterized protein n=1 Tax=Paspalum notatum var. saurae TaxID=547442 RepID=A0AAQ3XF92_PASNO